MYVIFGMAALNHFPDARDLWPGCDWHIPPNRRNAMFRKLVLALGATTAIAAAALAPTSALAWHHHHHHGHWGHGFGFGIYAPTYVAGPDCYRVKRAVELPDGTVRIRRVLVCD